MLTNQAVSYLSTTWKRLNGLSLIVQQAIYLFFYALPIQLLFYLDLPLKTSISVFGANIVINRENQQSLSRNLFPFFYFMGCIILFLLFFIYFLWPLTIFQFFLYNAVGYGFPGSVITVRLFPYPFDGFLVTVDVEHLVLPKQVIRIASAP